ncbi:MAG: RluA family pseudouridine synthase [Candidatus Omnitrophica bacterium]|nr:RluA family pseudouridine synthase [Candidatus Omnitrophota bacterium]
MRAGRVEIIFEDAHLAVVSKPAGLLSQGEIKGDPNLVEELRGYFGRYYVGLVHRLDRNTSGLMVVAKRSKAAARLTAALQSGELQRIYQAWLCGHLAQAQQWHHWLFKDEAANRTRAFKNKTGSAKEALLRVTPLRTVRREGQDYTLAQFTLETGRSHQIRVQSAFEGYPLAGDKKYGPRPEGRAVISRPALHSAHLSFPHPMSAEKMTFDLALPEDMRWI